MTLLRKTSNNATAAQKRRRFRRAKSAFRILALGAALGAAFPLIPSSSAGIVDGKVKFYTIKTEHFYIDFQEDLGPIAEQMRTIVEEAYTRLTARHDWQPHGRTHVVLTDKTDTANGLAMVIPANYIILHVTPPDADSSLDYYQDYLRLLFGHEFTHIVHIDQVRGTATPLRTLFGKVIAPNGISPSWFREGMAVYEESLIDPRFGRIHSPYTDMILRTAVYENKFPRIDQIAGLTTHFPDGTGPYQFGARFMNFLSETYGEDRLYKFNQEYAGSLWFFALNNKARRVYGKSFYKLWDEFEASCKKRYGDEKANIEGQGLTPLTDVVNTEESATVYVPRPGGGNAYFLAGFDEAARIIVNTPDSKTPIEIKRRPAGQMSFSKTGRYLAFNSYSSIEPKTSFSEVFYYDTVKRKLFRVSDKDHTGKPLRLADPDFSSRDGGERWLITVRTFGDTDQLVLWDLFERKQYVLTNAPQKTQFDQPRFSPDGSKIAVSRRDPDGKRDIVLYSDTGTEIRKLTSDDTLDSQPWFASDGQHVLFSSYRTGIANIFSADIETGDLTQITNVLTGVFHPTTDGSGTLYVETYGSDKTVIQKMANAVAQSSVVPADEANNFVIPASMPIGQPRAGTQTLDPRSTASNNSGTTELSSEQPIATNSSVIPVQTGISLLQRDSRFRGNDTNFTAVDSDSPFVNHQQDPNPPDQPPTTDEMPIPVAPTLKKDENTGAHKNKDYPSAYKDAVGNLPHDLIVDKTLPKDAKKYSALPQLLVPKYVIPSILAYDNAALVQATVGRSDPLFRHTWTAFANYRTDAAFLGGGGNYVYSRYNPGFYIGGVRYVVDWGVVNGTSTRFFEERWQAYTGLSYSHGRNLFRLTYFYENRSAYTNLTVNLLNMKPYAGLRVDYRYGRGEKFPDSISTEDGYLVKITAEATPSILGSSSVNEEYTTTADFRYYLEMPWSNHHVLALRAAGGWTWGDPEQFGVFRLGGPFGEGVGAANLSAKVLPLRGLAGITFGGDRVAMFSAEYRWPLIENINHGIGTWPVFLDKLYFTPFVDAGDIKYRSDPSDLFTRMMFSAGAELRGDFVLGYGLPIVGRLGYGVILTNRDRLGTLQDSVTGASLKFGSIYLQVGTSF